MMISFSATYLDGSIAGTPTILTEGKHALLTCVVRNIGDHTLIWKNARGQVLTAGENRVTTDKRINILHDEGGDVYVLSIESVETMDSGTYSCEVNTEPPSKMFYQLAGKENNKKLRLGDAHK